MARLTYANGVVVEVDDSKAESLLSRGYSSATEKKTTAKKASSSKTDK